MIGPTGVDAQDLAFATTPLGGGLDLRTELSLDISRWAAVGDFRWAKLLYHQWRAIAPVWPVAPTEMRYYELQEHRRALDRVATINTNPNKKQYNS
jgi:hypothetical protein